MLAWDIGQHIGKHAPRRRRLDCLGRARLQSEVRTKEFLPRSEEVVGVPLEGHSGLE